MRRAWRPALLSGALALAAGALPLLLYAAGNDWPVRDGDAAGRRYSTLTQITPANVSRLERAWEFDTGTGNLQVTPVVVSGVMYLGAGSSIWALEPETARTIWKFDAPDVVSRRGIAYWPGDRTTSPRIISGAGDRMVALDAKTGRPVSGFGVLLSLIMSSVVVVGGPVSGSGRYIVSRSYCITILTLWRGRAIRENPCS